LTAEDIKMIGRGEVLPPRVSGIPLAPAIPPVAMPAPVSEPRRNPLLGGPEPSPA
jgi:hypothetical protein